MPYNFEKIGIEILPLHEVQYFLLDGILGVTKFQALEIHSLRYCSFEKRERTASQCKVCYSRPDGIDTRIKNGLAVDHWDTFCRIIRKILTLDMAASRCGRLIVNAANFLTNDCFITFDCHLIAVLRASQKLFCHHLPSQWSISTSTLLIISA